MTFLIKRIFQHRIRKCIHVERKWLLISQKVNELLDQSNAMIDCLGTGLSKKIAKRLAATNLLNILENLGPEEKKALLNRAEGQVYFTHIDY